ncbi:FAM58A [Bugula neritina]|uniref:FAM58A n=1 Tax=Bugula neritina TaxID=10212 RepID=A0A7J7IVP7_BUGNE|nr:FAM58A [Bugula neritina]
MSFWDMLTSHTKVAGGSLPLEQITLPVAASSATTSSHSKCTWSSEERQLFKTASFITTCARKLEVGSLVKSNACWLFYKFFSIVQLEHYDEYVVAMTCLFLASKIEETPVKIRDVINVAHRTLHPREPPLQIDQTYSSLVDTLINFELLICRMLNFKLTYDYPHKYLLHYLKSLTEWMPAQHETEPYQRVAWSILNDCFSTKICIRNRPDQLALAACYLALESCDIKVYMQEHAEKPWWKVFIEDIRLSDISQLVAQILEMYENETAVTSFTVP